MSAFSGIQATVLQKNAQEQFFCDPCGGYGKTMTIPCGGAVTEVGDPYWAVPVNNDYVQGFRYIADDGSNTAPAINSLPVFKLTNTQNADYYWVVGYAQDYFENCAACCDASPFPSMVEDSLPNIAAVQNVCVNVSTIPQSAYFALPPLLAGERWVLAGSVNGTQLTPAPTFASGLDTGAEVETYLNNNWGADGDIVWDVLPNSPNDGGFLVTATVTETADIGFMACPVTA